jgi:DNA-binding response OmpR family regulator
MAGRARILVVEHKTPLGMRMAYLLTCAGHEVQAAHTGRSAMELARENPFDLIILSTELPDLSAFELCRRLKEAPVSHATPVVFVSSQPRKEDIQHGLEIGAADYITTPFEATDFIFRIVSQVKVKAPHFSPLCKRQAAGLEAVC